jgi:hypothetical protein
MDPVIVCPLVIEQLRRSAMKVHRAKRALIGDLRSNLS